MRKHKVGCVPDGRIAIRDADGHVRGHCGPHMVAGGVMRFGIRNPQLVNAKGKLEWREGDAQSRRRVRRPSADRKHALGSVKS